MLHTNIIEKALRLNNVCENDVILIKTDTTIAFSIHLLSLLVLLLYNFFLKERVEEDKQFNFIMTNLTSILDIVTTELKIALHNFITLYTGELEEIVELHNKDECLLVIAIQDKVYKKLEKLIKKEV